MLSFFGKRMIHAVFVVIIYVIGCCLLFGGGGELILVVGTITPGQLCSYQPQDLKLQFFLGLRVYSLNKTRNPSSSLPWRSPVGGCRRIRASFEVCIRTRLKCAAAIEYRRAPGILLEVAAVFISLVLVLTW